MATPTIGKDSSSRHSAAIYADSSFSDSRPVNHHGNFVIHACPYTYNMAPLVRDSLAGTVSAETHEALLVDAAETRLRLRPITVPTFHVGINILLYHTCDPRSLEFWEEVAMRAAADSKDVDLFGAKSGFTWPRQSQGFQSSTLRTRALDPFQTTHRSKASQTDVESHIIMPTLLLGIHNIPEALQSWRWPRFASSSMKKDFEAANGSRPCDIGERKVSMQAVLKLGATWSASWVEVEHGHLYTTRLILEELAKLVILASTQPNMQRINELAAMTPLRLATGKAPNSLHFANDHVLFTDLSEKTVSKVFMGEKIRFLRSLESSESTGLEQPTGLCIHSDGSILVTDARANVVRRLGAPLTWWDDRIISSVFAGTGQAGYKDGPYLSASFDEPGFISKDPSEDIYIVADTGNNAIRLLANGNVSTISTGHITGPLSARFSPSYGVLVADTGNHRIRTIQNGLTQTLAGSGDLRYADGPVYRARFCRPSDAIEATKGTVFICDSGNGRIRMIYNERVSTISYSDHIKLDFPLHFALSPGGELFVSDAVTAKILHMIVPDIESARARGTEEWALIKNPVSDGFSARAAFLSSIITHFCIYGTIPGNTKLYLVSSLRSEKYFPDLARIFAAVRRQLFVNTQSPHNERSTTLTSPATSSDSSAGTPPAQDTNPLSNSINSIRLQAAPSFPQEEKSTPSPIGSSRTPQSISTVDSSVWRTASTPSLAPSTPPPVESETTSLSAAVAPASLPTGFSAPSEDANRQPPSIADRRSASPQLASRLQHTSSSSAVPSSSSQSRLSSSSRVSLLPSETGGQQSATDDRPTSSPTRPFRFSSAYTAPVSLHPWNTPIAPTLAALLPREEACLVAPSFSWTACESIRNEPELLFWEIKCVSDAPVRWSLDDIRLTTKEGEGGFIYNFSPSKGRLEPGEVARIKILVNIGQLRELWLLIFVRVVSEPKTFNLTTMSYPLEAPAITSFVPVLIWCCERNSELPRSFASALQGEAVLLPMFGETMRLNPSRLFPLRTKNDVASAPLPTLYWKIEQELLTDEVLVGMGSSASVYRASIHGLTVAVKKWDIGTRDATPEDFSVEVQAFTQFNHPKLLRFYGANSAPGVAYIVTEFADRGTLHDWLLKSPVEERTWERKLKMALDVAEALNYLHSLSWIHRDVKGLNVLLLDNLDARLADFGSSSAVHKKQAQGVGSFHWMAPEVAASTAYSTQSDVFSFGILLLELMIEAPPLRTTEQIRLGQIEPSHLSRHQISHPAFIALIESCCKPSPLDRISINDAIRHLKDQIENKEIRGATPKLPLLSKQRPRSVRTTASRSGLATDPNTM